MSAAQLKRFRLTGTIRIIDTIIASEDWMEHNRMRLCDGLAAVIGETADPSIRRNLIDARRAIYNKRDVRKVLSPRTLVYLKGAYPAGQEGLLSKWVKRMDLVDRLLNCGEQVFEADIISARDCLKSVILRPAFRGGLLFSQQSLITQYVRYSQHWQKQVTKALQRTELTLARYVSRAAMKHSPLGSFMRSMFFEWSDSASPLIFKRNRKDDRPCEIKFNRAIAGHIADVLSAVPTVAERLPLRLNSSVIQNGTELLLLRRRYGRTAPRIIRVPVEEVVALPDGAKLLPVMQRLLPDGAFVTIAQLSQELSTFCATPSHARKLVGNLLRVGVLENALVIPQDCSDVLQPIVEILDTQDGELERNLRNEILKLRSLVSSYASACTRDYPGYLREIENSCAEIFKLLDVNYAEFAKAPKIFGSCVDTRFTLSLPKSRFATAIRDLGQALETAPRVVEPDMAAWRKCLQSVSHKVRFPIPFMEFLRYAFNDRQLCNALAAAAVDRPEQTPTLVTTNVPLEERGEFGNGRLPAKSTTQGTSHITRKRPQELHYPTSGLAKSNVVHDRNTSGRAWYTCYVQPYFQSSGEIGFVVNRVVSGPGRALVRAISDVPNWTTQKTIMEEIRSAIRVSITSDAIACELSESFDFNANAHPQVLTTQIRYGNLKSSRYTRTLSLSELEVDIGSNDSKIIVRAHLRGGNIQCFDFGSMIAGLQPHVYRLLRSLGPPELDLAATCMAIVTEEIPAGEVYHVPRVSKGSCILRRCGWLVPVERLPRKSQHASEFAFFLEIQRWRRRIGLPDEVFIKARVPGEKPSAQGEKSMQLARILQKERKPEYLDFRSYVFVKVFEKLCSNATSFLYFEEAFPNLQDLLRMGIKRPIELALDIEIS